MRALSDAVRCFETIHCFVSDAPNTTGPAHIAVRSGEYQISPDIDLIDREELNADIWELVNSGEYTLRLAYVGFGVVLERRPASSPAAPP